MNEKKSKVPDWEKIARKAASCAGIDIAEFDDSYYLDTPPADNALGEAVKRFIDENVLTDAAISLREGAGKKSIDVSINEVKKLKAAHKQAGGG